MDELKKITEKLRREVEKLIKAQQDNSDQGIDLKTAGIILGCSTRAIKRNMNLFQAYGLKVFRNGSKYVISRNSAQRCLKKMLDKEIKIPSNKVIS
ncbi:MAG: hypothetical protein JEZ07_06355 [Phycisphaerae bacterium]|nr:hypothetical protein [Phycisphaerae bacterium]